MEAFKIVNQLRADGGLRQNQLNGGERIARVAVEHRKEGLVSFGRIESVLVSPPVAQLSASPEIALTARPRNSRNLSA